MLSAAVVGLHNIPKQHSFTGTPEGCPTEVSDKKNPAFQLKRRGWFAISANRFVGYRRDNVGIPKSFEKENPLPASVDADSAFLITSGMIASAIRPWREIAEPV